MGKSTAYFRYRLDASEHEQRWLLLPMVMIFLVNAALSYSYLKLERRQAIIFGAVMGVFTAPWLLPTLPYVWGWVG